MSELVSNPFAFVYTIKYVEFRAWKSFLSESRNYVISKGVITPFEKVYYAFWKGVIMPF